MCTHVEEYVNERGSAGTFRKGGNERSFIVSRWQPSELWHLRELIIPDVRLVPRDESIRGAA